METGGLPTGYTKILEMGDSERNSGGTTQGSDTFNLGHDKQLSLPKSIVEVYNLLSLLILYIVEQPETREEQTEVTRAQQQFSYVAIVACQRLSSSRQKCNCTFPRLLSRIIFYDPLHADT